MKQMHTAMSFISKFGEKLNQSSRKAISQFSLSLLGGIAFFWGFSSPAFGRTWTTYYSYSCSTKNFPNCKIILQVDMASIVDRRELTFASLRSLRADAQGSHQSSSKSLTANCSKEILSTTSEFDPKPFTFYRKDKEWLHQEHFDAGYRKPMRQIKGFNNRTYTDYDIERNNLFYLVCGN